MKNTIIFQVIIIVIAGIILVSDSAQSEQVKITQGEYMGQKWYIDKNHILYWDGKPYVPHAINDYPEIRPLMSKEDIDDTLAVIDLLMDNGITEISVVPNVFITEDQLPFVKEELNKKDVTPQDIDAIQKKMRDNLKIVVDHITERGGTYILIYSIQPVVSQFGGGNIIYESIGGEIKEASISISLEFMLNQKTRQTYQEQLRKFKQVATTKALRGFLFNWETNGQEKITGTPKELASGLGKMLDIYGKIVKEEIADVPVFYGISDSVTGFREVLPYLSGVCADNIDGIYFQIHGAMPEEIRFHAKQSLITRQLNSCSKTKLFWGYGQATPVTVFSLYRSKQLMYDHYQEMIDVGMTGFMYDQISSWGFIQLGQPETEKLRIQNVKWWGELKPMLKSEILSRAKNNKFSSGKWAVPIKPRELKFKKPKMLTKKQVYEIAQNHPDVKRVINLGAELGEPVFNPDYGIWDIYVVGLNVNMWVEDSKEGKVLLNEIKLIDEARKAGYPIPSEKWLIKKIIKGLN